MGRESALDRWGPCAWKYMHVSSWCYPETPSDTEKQNMFVFLFSLAHTLPCARCRTHWLSYLNSKIQNIHTEHLQTRKQLTHFLVAAHNDVNARLGKPAMTYKDAQLLYDPTIPHSSAPPCIFTILLIAIVAMFVFLIAKSRTSSAQVQNKYKTFPLPVDNER